MAGGRSQRPLFDLLPGGLGKTPARPESAPASPPPAPPEVVSATLSELKPRVTIRPVPMDPEPPAPQAERQAPPAVPAADPPPSRAPDAWTSAMLSGGMIRVRAYLVYLLGAAWLLSLVMVWVLGNWWGEAAADRRLASEIGRNAPVPTDPLRTAAGSADRPDAVAPQGPADVQPPQAVTSPRPRTQPPATPESGATPVQPASPAGTGTGQFLVATGRTDQDPRTAGLNYLVLATLDEEETARAIRFLADAGLNCLGVPVRGAVDRGREGGNTPSYRLVVLAGITGQDFREARPVRTRLEADVRRLGQVWQREQRGSSNFGKPAWEKFTP